MRVISTEEINATCGGTIDTGGEIAGTVILMGSFAMVGGLLGGPVGAGVGANLGLAYAKIIMD